MADILSPKEIINYATSCDSQLNEKNATSISIAPSTGTYITFIPLLYRFISDWLFEGVCHDPFGEFFISVNDHYLVFRGKCFSLLPIDFQTKQFLLIIVIINQERATQMTHCEMLGPKLLGRHRVYVSFTEVKDLMFPVQHEQPT